MHSKKYGIVKFRWKLIEITPNFINEFLQTKDEDDPQVDDLNEVMSI